MHAYLVPTVLFLIPLRVGPDKEVLHDLIDYKAASFGMLSVKIQRDH